MSAEAPRPLLRVRGLVKHFHVGPRRLFGGRRELLRAVDGVDLDLHRGHSLGLVGESGCGKSTLARTILGLHPRTAGSIQLDGVELGGLSRRRWLQYRRRIQMIFQDPYGSLDPRQTIGSILTEPLAIHGIGRRRERLMRACALLETVGLAPRHLNRYPHEFSGGQRQRIGIARALALEPDIIVCDEPVSALDVSIQAQIINLLKELQQRLGIAYLFIAHDLAVVRQLCDQIAVMYLGKIVERASRDELFARPLHPYTRALLSAVPTPDPVAERERRRIPIDGDVPSPTAPPSGCSFHPRCPERDNVPGERCLRDAPGLDPAGRAPGRLVACHLDR